MVVPSWIIRWLPGLVLALVVSAPAAEKPQTWREVRSPHFTVATNGNEKHARRIAYQFEAIRAVMRRMFPRLRIDPNPPIIVLVAEGKKTFQALEPADWSGKGQLKRAGMFQRGPEKNYVLMWGDAPGNDPYSIIYHEYTHLVIEQSGLTVPLWLNEGLAQFYGHSEIRETEVGLGRPSPEDIALLRQTRLLPLPTLFTVDHSSPYYNEQHKGSIFYSESWALTHYLMTRRQGDTRDRIVDYLNLVNQQVDPVTAAQRAFGDLGKLQQDLENYTRQTFFYYFLVKGATEVDEDAFAARVLSPAESAVLRGDFSAYLQQYPRARTLLQEALRDDPHCAPAYESLGYVELEQHHLEEARKWFSQAVKLNSGSYLAQYYFAAMTMQEGWAAATSPEVEASLRAAIRINPAFAPAYSSLAMWYRMRDENLEEAHQLALKAVDLEPGNFQYVYNTANLLLRMKQTENAERVAEKALSLANSAEERFAAQALVDNVRRYQQSLAMREQARERRKAAEQEEPQLHARSAETGPVTTPAPLETPSKRAPETPVTAATVEGKVTEASCTPSGVMKLTLALPHYDLDLHAQDYRHVEFHGANPMPGGSGNPCRSLQGVNARVTFKPDAGAGEIVSIDVQK